MPLRLKYVATLTSAVTTATAQNVLSAMRALQADFDAKFKAMWA